MITLAANLSNANQSNLDNSVYGIIFNLLKAPISSYYSLGR